MMYLVGQKVMTPKLQQGYVDEITKHDEVVVCVVSEKIDAQTPPYDEFSVVRDIYQADDEKLTLCVNQKPNLEDLTRFGIVKSMNRHADGIIECHFSGTNGDPIKEYAIWLSENRMKSTEADNIAEYEDAHWIKGEYYDDVLNAFHLENSGYGVVPKTLNHDSIPFECVVEVMLADGSLRQLRASVTDPCCIDEVEIEADGIFKNIHTILELKELGVARAHFIAKHNIEGFDPIE